MTTHSSILAWEVPWTEEPGRLQSIGSKKSQHSLAVQHLQPACLRIETETIYSLKLRRCLIAIFICISLRLNLFTHVLTLGVSFSMNYLLTFLIKLIIISGSVSCK